jgi:hypothetical protein
MSLVNISVSEFLRLYQHVIGSDPDTQCAYDVVNAARMIAYSIGSWTGIISYESVPVHNGTVYLPAHLDVIREARCCNGDKLEISAYTKDMYVTCGEPVGVKLMGRTAFPFQLTDHIVMFRNISSKDNGKVMTVTYKDYAGSFREEEVTFNQDYIRLSYRVSNIIRITKDKTVGAVEGAISSTSACDNLSSFLIDAFDVSPWYSVYCFHNVCPSCIAVEAKKRYRPYLIDYDENTILDLNAEALSFLVLAIKKKNSSEPTAMDEYSKAVAIGTGILTKEMNQDQGTKDGTVDVQLNESWAESIQHI